ncbi:hypothetical protein GCM10010304_36740 [Streptomyces roseoviolaceus]
MASPTPGQDDFWEHVRAAYPEQQPLLNRNPDRTMWSNGTLTVVDGAQTFAQMPVSFRDLDSDFFITVRTRGWARRSATACWSSGREPSIVRGPCRPPSIRRRCASTSSTTGTSARTTRPAGRHPAGGALPPGDRGPGRPRARTGADPVPGGAAAAIPGFRLHTPLDTETLGAVNLFSVDGLDARAVEQELRDAHQVRVKYREVRHLSSMRVSPHIYMRESELDRFVDVLAEVVDNQSAGRS